MQIRLLTKDYWQWIVKGCIATAGATGCSRQSGHGLTTFSATNFFFTILCLLVTAQPPYDSTLALHGRTTFQQPTTTLSRHLLNKVKNTEQTGYSVYFTVSWEMSPKIAHSLGEIWTPYNDFLGLPESITQMAPQLVQPFLPRDAMHPRY